MKREAFKGARKRGWGKWVSEIRVPNSRARIWLGSFLTAEEAARVFDAASLFLRGPSSCAQLNFPHSPLVPLPPGLLLKLSRARSAPPKPKPIASPPDCFPLPLDDLDVSTLITFDELPIPLPSI